jgi:2-C-methyl-D-erythritol 2,4-cyclodiphosphate synthase
MRIGFGYDSHHFTEGDGLPVGGVWVPYQQGVLAHSDGDVVLHALIDALLGAAALGDIGQHFPDTDPQYQNQSSDFFVKQVLILLKEAGYQINNIDATVIAEAPKLSAYKSAIRSNLADLLSLSLSAVSLKATTNEGMGWIGQREGLAATVVVCLSSLVE